MMKAGFSLDSTLDDSVLLAKFLVSIIRHESYSINYHSKHLYIKTTFVLRPLFYGSFDLYFNPI